MSRQPALPSVPLPNAAPRRRRRCAQPGAPALTLYPPACPRALSAQEHAAERACYDVLRGLLRLISWLGFTARAAGHISCGTVAAMAAASVAYALAPLALLAIRPSAFLRCGTVCVCCGGLCHSCRISPRLASIPLQVAPRLGDGLECGPRRHDLPLLSPAVPPGAGGRSGGRRAGAAARRLAACRDGPGGVAGVAQPRSHHAAQWSHPAHQHFPPLPAGACLLFCGHCAAALLHEGCSGAGACSPAIAALACRHLFPYTAPASPLHTPACSQGQLLCLMLNLRMNQEVCATNPRMLAAVLTAHSRFVRPAAAAALDAAALECLCAWYLPALQVVLGCLLPCAYVYHHELGLRRSAELPRGRARMAATGTACTLRRRAAFTLVPASLAPQALPGAARRTHQGGAAAPRAELSVAGPRPAAGRVAGAAPAGLLLAPQHDT